MQIRFVETDDPIRPELVAAEDGHGHLPGGRAGLHTRHVKRLAVLVRGAGQSVVENGVKKASLRAAAASREIHRRTGDARRDLFDGSPVLQLRGPKSQTGRVRVAAEQALINAVHLDLL